MKLKSEIERELKQLRAAIKGKGIDPDILLLRYRNNLIYGQGRKARKVAV